MLTNNQNNVYTVKDITNYIKGIIDTDQLLTNVWIKGEISNFTHHSRGHMYFTLKDETSRLRTIMFAGNNRYLKFIPKNGTKVIARGYISIYERDGQYQFYVQEMQPDGIGQLYLAYEQLKKRLEDEGLFSNDLKQKIPSYPKNIGVITSPTGAAIRDILTTIKRRYPIVNIVIYPVQVQGETAASTIATAISKMNDYQEIDILIIGRGGGSIEELWAFNEEIVARSIHKSKIPIISAVGHETDFTISDFVADVRAATPTAAAELAVPNINELKATIDYLQSGLQREMINQLENGKKNLNKIHKSVVFIRPKQQLFDNAQRLTYLEERLSYSLTKNISKHKEKYLYILQGFLREKPENKIKMQRDKLIYLNKHLVNGINNLKVMNERALDKKISNLEALSPLNVMKRGYAILYDEQEENVLISVKDVQPGDIVKIKLSDGKLDCHVWGLEEERNERD